MGELPADQRAHRSWLVSQTVLPDSGAAADLGCGTGEDLRLLARHHKSPGLVFVGVDTSASAGEALTAATASDGRIRFVAADLDGKLPLGDHSLDLVYSSNLVECLRNPGAFAAEIARVLKPGGQVVIGHWDWDSQLFDGSDKSLVRRLVSAYSDWQQAWMANSDGWMGRRLWGTFNSAGVFSGDVHARVLVNTEYSDPWFGHRNAAAIGSLVKRGLASAEDYAQFSGEQTRLHANGRYFYSITGYAHVGTRRAI